MGPVSKVGGELITSSRAWWAESCWSGPTAPPTQTSGTSTCCSTSTWPSSSISSTSIRRAACTDSDLWERERRWTSPSMASTPGCGRVSASFFPFCTLDTCGSSTMHTHCIRLDTNTDPLKVSQLTLISVDEHL